MNLDWCDTYCYEVDHLTCLATLWKVTASYKPILQSSTSAVLSNLIFLAKDYDAEQPNSNGPNWLNVFLLCASNGFICNILATAIQYTSQLQLQRASISWVLFVQFRGHFEFVFAHVGFVTSTLHSTYIGLDLAHCTKCVFQYTRHHIAHTVGCTIVQLYSVHFVQ